jgi:GAF domain-containing protein/HAMP domain-containing protein
MRWTVRQKLMLSFFLMAILMAAIGAFSVYNLNQLNTSTEAILREHQPVLTDMAAIEGGVLFHSLKVDQYVTTGNKAHLRAVEELRSDVETHLADLADRARGTEDQQLVQEIREAYDTYMSLSDGMRAFYHSNPDDTLAVAGRQMRIAALLENALLAKADALYEAKQSKAQELIRANHQLYLNYVRTAVVSSLVLTVLAISLGFSIARSIIVPIGQLVETTQRVAGGDLTARAQVRTSDEIGVLAKAFNSMAAQLWELVENLEQRVAERTREYEEAVVRTQQAYAQLYEAHQKLEVTTYQAQHRAMQLETAADVSRAATSVLDPDELLRQAVDLIRDRFDLYYAGLFLLDESGHWAVLRAGTGEPGRQMLKAGHKLEVGGRSMVGWCTANAQARIALDVGEEAVRFDNPLLPDTRSEMALPLASRGQVIGALDVQSVEAGAFSDEDISVLQTLADQIAVAIDNAYLFAEAQARLEKVQAAHRSYLRVSWDEFLPTRKTIDYECVQPGVTLPSEAVLPKVRQVMEEERTVVLPGSGDGEEEPAPAQSALVTPITLRGQIIGALGLQETEGARQWTADEIALVEAVADQMALAIENARLFAEAQRRLREITTLYEASQSCLSISDQESLLAAIVEAAAQTTGATLGSVMLLDEKKGEYVFGATYGMSEETIAAIQTELQIPLEEGLIGAIVTTGQPLVVADVTTDPRWIPSETKELMRSFLGVPLVSGDGRPFGALALSHPEVDAFDENHARLLSTFANQAALAIENARLFEAAQGRARRERLIREITGKVQGSIDLDAILQTTVQELSKALGASHAVVRLGTEAELATPLVEEQADSDVG